MDTHGASDSIANSPAGAAEGLAANIQCQKTEKRSLRIRTARKVAATKSAVRSR